MKLACVDALGRARPPGALRSGDRRIRRRAGPLRSREADSRGPFDPRLLTEIAPAGWRAPRWIRAWPLVPVEDFDAYRERLSGFVFRSGLVMKPVFRARHAPRRSASSYGEGEERRVLQAVRRQWSTRGWPDRSSSGRPEGDPVAHRGPWGLNLAPERDFDLVNILRDVRFPTYWGEYHRVMGRKGVLAGRGEEHRAVTGDRGGGARAAASATPTRCCAGTVGGVQPSPALRARSHRDPRGGAGSVHDVGPYPAERHVSSCATPTSTPGAERRGDRGDDPARMRRDPGVSGSSRRSRSCPARISARTIPRPPSVCAGPPGCSTRPRLGSRWTARCTPMRRSPNRSGPGCCRDSRLKGQANLPGDAERRGGEHRPQPAARARRRGLHRPDRDRRPRAPRTSSRRPSRCAAS